jgi:PAS domain S-box-containing protein
MHMIKGDLIDSGQLPMGAGTLTLEQVNLILNHLPVEITFVDDREIVRYYNAQDAKMFSRKPEIIGGTVQECHSLASRPAVDKIIDAFRSGEKDVSELWIKHDRKLVHIRYFAVRDRDGKYRGCLEVVQDITNIRKLRGERKVDW